MPSTPPDPSNWTLRLKKHKTTILLFVTETQSFHSIKSELLLALKATGVREINGKPLPDNAEDIVLGVPMDKNRIEKGWVNLAIEEPEDEERVISLPKGVRKSVLNGSPLGAGLKDGAMLAFRFRREGEKREREREREGEDDDDDDDDDGWDVIMPVYDDEEDEDEGEGGQGRGRARGEEREGDGDGDGDDEGEGDEF